MTANLHENELLFKVYERQWKLSNMSVAAISDYLGKVKRRSLVLKECLNTVPSDVGAVRELLNYGLLETGRKE